MGFMVPSWMIVKLAPGVHQYDLRLKYLSPVLYVSSFTASEMFDELTYVDSIYMLEQ